MMLWICLQTVWMITNLPPLPQPALNQNQLNLRSHPYQMKCNGSLNGSRMIARFMDLIPVSQCLIGRSQDTSVTVYSSGSWGQKSSEMGRELILNCTFDILASCIK